MVKIDSKLHLRNFLRGLEASIVIFVSILLYDLLKKYELKNIKFPFIPEENYKLITNILHFLSIFVSEVVVVYILVLIFGVEF